MENKQEILNLLLPALQATRNFRNLKSLEYNAKNDVVIATVTNSTGGFVEIVNVAFDSGSQMILDVLKQLID